MKYQVGRALFGAIPIGALDDIEGGSQRIGTWVEEERNVYEDYRLAFGEEPPTISGGAIMSDTDNMKERAVAYEATASSSKR